VSTHFLAIENESPERLGKLLQMAAALRPLFVSGGASSVLAGKTVVLAFFETSTRTRSSFARAAALLGMTPINFDAALSSTQKGESLQDTVRNLAAMRPHLFVVRHSEAGAPRQVADWSGLPTINAGEGSREHPSQALLDAFCLQRHFGKLAGLNVVICGDLRHSRVARSNLHFLTKMGATVTLCSPPTLGFDPGMKLPEGARVNPDFDDAIKDADAVMLLRLQHERMSGPYLPPGGEYRSRWGMTTERAASLQKHAMVMHPGPMNRGIEIDSEVADGPRSMILTQVEGGVLCRAALYLELLGKTAEQALGKSLTP
jgi:aspartate carbamoyltransferase catalytic subunit